MLTKTRLDNMDTITSKEKLVINTLWRNDGAMFLPDILKSTGIAKNTFFATIVKRSPYIDYNKESGIVKLERKGKDIQKSWKINLKNPLDCTSIGAFVMSIFFSEGELSFIDMCNRVKEYCNCGGKPLGAFCSNKAAHYGFYKRMARKWRDLI